MIIKDFHLPTAVSNPIWSLTDKQKFFLDMTLVHKVPHSELYRMVVDVDNLTYAQCRSRAAALVTSMDGVDYLKARGIQLTNYFYPHAGSDKNKKIGADGFSEGFQQKAIAELERIAGNPSDPNFFDAIKVVMAKLSKDLLERGSMLPPQRYLPEMCSTCRYKVFCEKETEDECTRCKYRDFANDNDVFYDYKNQLRPLEEPENPVKTTE